VRCLQTAQHEAAHVVVGVALGLRLRRAVVSRARPGWTSGGYCEWHEAPARPFADALMYAAGVAWEDALGHGEPEHASGDLRLLTGVVGRGEVRAAVRAAGALLVRLAPTHALVTRALAERDLTARDVARLLRGERLGDD
jgi:hypothetical protein